MQKSKVDQDRSLGNVHTALPRQYNQFIKAIIMVKLFTLPLIQLKLKKAGPCIIHIVKYKRAELLHTCLSAGALERTMAYNQMKVWVTKHCFKYTWRRYSVQEFHFIIPTIPLFVFAENKINTN